MEDLESLDDIFDASINEDLRFITDFPWLLMISFKNEESTQIFNIRIPFTLLSSYQLCGFVSRRKNGDGFTLYLIDQYYWVVICPNKQQRVFGNEDEVHCKRACGFLYVLSLGIEQIEY